MIYVDERKSRIGVIERRARRSLGMIAPSADSVFANTPSPFLWRRTKVSRGMSTSRAVALIVALILLLCYVI